MFYYLGDDDQKPASLRREAGFTLPELIVTLIVIGILAAVAVPRFVTRSEFDVFGFTEQTRAALRFAQKSAITKRRTVCVTLAANSLSLAFASTFGGACDTPVLNPAGNPQPAADQNYRVAAVNGIAITAATITFDPLGKPGNAQALSVIGGSSTQIITVEAETGYVH